MSNHQHRRQITPRGHDTGLTLPPAGVDALVRFANASDLELSGFVQGVAAEADRTGFADVGSALREAAQRIMALAFYKQLANNLASDLAQLTEPDPSAEDPT